MSKINDGGPAFPSGAGYSTDGERVVEYRAGDTGLSIRDWFAGQAMQARLTGANLPRLDICDQIAVDAYAIADAMLKARERQP